MRTSFLPLLFLAVPATAQWVSIAPGGLNEFEAVLVDDATHFLIAGENGNGQRTTDGGATWTPVSGLGTETIRDLLRLDDQTILAASDGVVLRSADNGTTWTTMSTPATDDLHALARFGDRVLAVGREGGIVLSDDGGFTWDAQFSGTSERLFAAWMRSADQLFAAGKSGVFLRSTNGGTTWTPDALPLTDDWSGMLFLPGNAQVGLVCGEDGSMVRSTDGGNTWSSISTGSTMGLTALASAHDSVVYAAGTTGTVLKSTDQGLTWTTMMSPAISELAAMDVRDGVAVAVGANGTVIKLDVSAVGLEEQARAVLGVHPVPASEQLFLRGDLQGATLVELIAMDGRTVRSERMQGPQEAMNVSSVPNGTYHLRATDARGVQAWGRCTVAH